MLPRILAERRWQQLLLLAGTGILQSLCLIALIDWARDIAMGDVALINSGQWLVGFLAIMLLAAGRYIERFYAEIMAQRYIYSLRQTVFDHAQQLSTEDLDLPGKGGTLLRLTGDMTAIRNWIVQGMAPLIVLGLWLLVSLIALLQLHYLLAVSLLVPLLMGVVGNYLMGRRLFVQSEKLRRHRGVMIRNVTEKLRHLKLIRVFNQRGKESRLFARQSGLLVQSQIRRARISAIMRAMNEAVLLLVMLSLISTGLYLQQQNALSGELMAVLMTAGIYLLGQLRRLTRLYEYWTLQKVASKKLNQFLSRGGQPDGSRRRNNRIFSLELKRVRCIGRFSSQSYLIESHSRVLLGGSPGSGKSTLLSVIAGLTTFEQGKILLSGRNINRYRNSFLSQQIALVSADLPLLRGSLKKNLFYGARKIDKEYNDFVMELCRLTSKEELPLGLRTRIAEDGANLSAGLKYRVMLARALLRQPALILLDDDVALQSPLIQDVIVDLSGFFGGAMIINNEAERLTQICNKRWELRSEKSRRTAKNSNVIDMGRYAKD
ncbi:ATP-binding cassette domain-containing protein [Amphritea balenae]|nr:ABC transporter ATP-binding protein [Amphritea balenae]GGK78247.1 multidrug ABC transporter ATP-binding protein [Amphritea balenae]